MIGRFLPCVIPAAGRDDLGRAAAFCPEGTGERNNNRGETGGQTETRLGIYTHIGLVLNRTTGKNEQKAMIEGDRHIHPTAHEPEGPSDPNQP